MSWVQDLEFLNKGYKGQEHNGRDGPYILSITNTTLTTCRQNKIFISKKDYGQSTRDIPFIILWGILILTIYPSAKRQSLISAADA